MLMFGWWQIVVRGASDASNTRTTMAAATLRSLRAL